MILTHPEFSRTRIPKQIQKELAASGVWIEKCWYNIGENEILVAEMVDNIKTVGAEYCYMTTDRGQSMRETPVEALKKFASTLLRNGISIQELNTMMKVVPQKVLNS